MSDELEEIECPKPLNERVERYVFTGLGVGQRPMFRVEYKDGTVDERPVGDFTEIELARLFGTIATA